MAKIVAGFVAIVGVMIGIVLLALNAFASGPIDATVLIPTNAAEVEACFNLADSIHETRGGESAYNVCSSNTNAYEAWKAIQ